MDAPERTEPPPGQRLELALVALVAFADPVIGSLRALATQASQPPITEAGLLTAIVGEALVLALLGLLLHVRGWRPDMLGLPFVWRDIPAAAMLTLGCWLLGVAAWMAASAVTGAPLAPRSLVEPGIPLATVALMSMINPVFEELFVCGYLVAVLKPWKGAAFAINVSTAVRLSYHLYQGTQAITIIPIGLLFAAWFARTGRLWPAILAHAVIDFVGLASAY